MRRDQAPYSCVCIRWSNRDQGTTSRSGEESKRLQLSVLWWSFWVQSSIVQLKASHNSGVPTISSQSRRPFSSSCLDILSPSGDSRSVHSWEDTWDRVSSSKERRSYSRVSSSTRWPRLVVLSKHGASNGAAEQAFREKESESAVMDTDASNDGWSETLARLGLRSPFENGWSCGAKVMSRKLCKEPSLRLVPSRLEDVMVVPWDDVVILDHCHSFHTQTLLLQTLFSTQTTC